MAGLPEVSWLGDEALAVGLKKYGVEFEPITDTTRKLYQWKLAKLMAEKTNLWYEEGGRKGGREGWRGRDWECEMLLSEWKWSVGSSSECGEQCECVVFIPHSDIGDT